MMIYDLTSNFTRYSIGQSHHKPIQIQERGQIPPLTLTGMGVKEFVTVF